ncbi:protein disulfide-isomerase domain [Verruconis gallopava]|uniref:protein disulfide-isomerase n=1 Tax=Verruconis gallopava TaxID=253628 RepID=A0A0D1Z4G2_9PEZI|nr:protein disulfide-isomerase domain [Verruconis gallopava]KIW07852.1 protein disulfide-isomerase domain [Verruconis gallopava]
MALSTSLALAAAAAIFSTPAHAGLYPKSSAVLSITGKTYDTLIAQSNYTSIVEFYAPWCGHCKNLQPAYEKAAQNLKGLAKVAAVDCDDDANKPFCGSMGVQGFPTLKIVRPGKKPGRPIIEDYQGARTAKAIVDAVVEKIPNHVKRVTDTTMDEWLKEANGKAKAILFSDKGTTSALLKSLAIDYLGSVSVAQVRDKEKDTVAKYGITKFPTFVVVPAGSEEPLVYSGDLKKEAMSKFITESTSILPNPDPAPEGVKKSKPKKDKKAEKGFKQYASDRSEDTSSEPVDSSSETLEEETKPSSDTTADFAKPVEAAEPIRSLEYLNTESELHTKCLNPKAKTCVLVLVPREDGKEDGTSNSAELAISNLSDIRHRLSGRGIFPFYAVSDANPLASSIREALSLKANAVEIIATNAKRSWVRRYEGETFGVAELSDWVDSIKMNEGRKEKLPEHLISDADYTTPKSEVPVPEASEEPLAAPKIVTDGGPIIIEEIEEIVDEPWKEDVKDEL